MGTSSIAPTKRGSAGWDRSTSKRRLRFGGVFFFFFALGGGGGGGGGRVEGSGFKV